jgi:hypothetical protein
MFEEQSPVGCNAALHMLPAFLPSCLVLLVSCLLHSKPESGGNMFLRIIG